jgi:Family of unknown function (DUF6056)
LIIGLGHKGGSGIAITHDTERPWNEASLKFERLTADALEMADGTPGSEGRNRRIHRVTFWLPSLVVFTLFGIIGRWVYWVADDFCRAVQRRNLGFLDMQLHEYRTWAGRYTSSALIGLAVKFGETSAHIAPVALTGFSLAICTMAALRIPASIVPKRYAPIVGTLGCLGLFGLFENFGQSVLWLTGGLTYFAPYLLLGVALLCAFPQTSNPRFATAARVAAPILTFLAVGCSEVVGATIVGGLVVACLFGAGGLRKPLWPSMLSSLIGFVVMAASPGNAIRRSINPHLPLRELPLSAAGETFRLMVWLISHRPLLVGVAIFVGTLLHPRSGLPVGKDALVGLEAQRRWGPPATRSPRSGLPVGKDALVGLEAQRRWGPPAMRSPNVGLRRGVEWAGLSMLFGLPYGAALLGYISTGQGLTPRARISAIVPMMLGIVLLSWFANSRWLQRKTQLQTQEKTAPNKAQRRITNSTVFLLCVLAIAVGAFQSIVPAALASQKVAGASKASTNNLNRNSGTTRPVGLIAPGTIWGLANFSGDGDWVLKCVESYYRVQGTSSRLEANE